MSSRKMPQRYLYDVHKESVPQRQASCERMDPIRKSSVSAYGLLINPPPSLRKINHKYNSMLTYIPVSVLFLVLGFGLGLKIGLG